MSNWRVLGLVLMREIRERGRSGAYLASTAITTLLILAGIILPTLFGGPTEFTVGFIGEGNQPIVDLAAEIANTGADEDELTTFEVLRYETIGDAEAALEDDSIDGVLVDGGEIVIRSASGAGGDSLSDLLQEAASTLAVAELVRETNTDVDVVGLLAGNPLELRTLEGVDTEENTGRTVIAYGGLVLMYIAVLSYGAWTLTGVTEEKSNRVVEVLLAAVKPWQLLAGKVIGIGLLGLAQFVLTLGIAMIAIRITGTFDLPNLPLDSLVVLVVWFLLGFGVYSVLMGAAGSLVSRTEDAQTASTPLTLTAVVGFFMSFQVLDDPNGIVGAVASYIPLTAPFVVPIRFALESISMFELVLSVLVTAASIVVLTRFAGRVYAGGLLQFGSRLKWREALRSGDL